MGSVGGQGVVGGATFGGAMSAGKGLDPAGGGSSAEASTNGGMYMGTPCWWR